MNYKIAILCILVNVWGTFYGMEKEVLTLKELVLRKTAQGLAERFLKEDMQAPFKEINEKVPGGLRSDLQNAIKDELCSRSLFFYSVKLSLNLLFFQVILMLLYQQHLVLIVDI